MILVITPAVALFLWSKNPLDFPPSACDYFIRFKSKSQLISANSTNPSAISYASYIFYINFIEITSGIFSSLWARLKNPENSWDRYGDFKIPRRSRASKSLQSQSLGNRNSCLRDNPKSRTLTPKSKVYLRFCNIRDFRNIPGTSTESPGFGIFVRIPGIQDFWNLAF